MLECLLHNATSMRRKECQRWSQAQWAETAKVMALKDPSIRTHLGSTYVEILKFLNKFMGKYMVAPSVFPCQWQEECIKELCQELTQCMARAGLQNGSGPTRPTVGSGRCSHGCSSSWAWFPSAGPWGAELAKCPRGDPLTGWSGSRRQHSHSRCRYRLKWCWSPLPKHPGRHQSPCPSPPWSHPTDKWLSCSLGDLHLHPQPRKSQSRVWRGYAHMHTAGHLPPLQKPMNECPPRKQKKKQVWFDVDEDLGHNPTLPTDLTTFLLGDTAKEWDNIPSPSPPLPMDPPQPPHRNGHQCYPKKAHPKVSAQPSAAAQSQSKSWLKGMPDPVDHPHWWIKTERDRVGDHTCWWKEEIRAIKKYTLESTLKRYTTGEDLNELEALYFSQWQAVASRLPCAQQEASCWWDSPPCVCGLHPQDFLLHTEASKLRDFQTVRQEKTLALAWVLQCCAERSGALTRVLCDMAWELQKCMAL